MCVLFLEYQWGEIMIIKYVISCFIACIGYGILFNIHGRKLLLVGLAGALGTLVYELALASQMSTILSLFVAAIVIGIYSEVMARICKCPVTIFVVCALIPFVPGGGMYKTMLYAIQGDVYQALTTCIETITASFVLVLGILAVGPFVRLIRKIKKEGMSIWRK